MEILSSFLRLGKVIPLLSPGFTRTIVFRKSIRKTGRHSGLTLTAGASLLFSIN